jgi:hypothetical protein
VIIVSRLYTLSRFGITSCGTLPPNRPENILIFQVLEEMLKYGEGAGLTKTSTLEKIVELFEDSIFLVREI